MRRTVLPHEQALLVQFTYNPADPVRTAHIGMLEKTCQQKMEHSEPAGKIQLVFYYNQYIKFV